MDFTSKINVTNTAIIISNYKMGDCLELEEIFKIWDPITHKWNIVGLYYDEVNKLLYLPGGMDIWKLRGYFNQKYFNRIDNHPYKPMPYQVMVKYKPRDMKQLEAIQFLTGLGAYESNLNAPVLSLSLNTGVGKTYCSIAAMSYFGVKSIVITGSNSLLAQWKSEILHYTNIDKSNIIKIEAPMINLVLSGKSKKADNACIYLVTHAALHSYAEQFGWDKIYKLFEILGIGIKIFDEAHQYFANMLMINFFTNTWKTIYCSATLGRSSWKEDRIFQVSIKNVPYIDLFDENNDPHTSYVAIKWNSKPSPMQISACKSKYGLDRNAYINYITSNPEFYNMMHIIMELVIKCKGRVLFYIGTNEGILRVYRWIAEYYPEYLGDIGIFTSLVNNEMKLEEKKKKLLLSTTKSAGLGEHIEGLKMTILLAEPFKSPILARQTLGRTRDKNTMYVELVDMGFKYLKKFYYDKLPVFKKYATDVTDTFIDSYELDRRAANIRKSRDNGKRCPFVFNDPRFDFENIITKIPKNNDSDNEYFIGSNPYLK